MANKITVHLSAREYYSGVASVDLPEGIEERHIDSVDPDGYGEFAIHLNNEGLNILMLVLADGRQWQQWGEWTKLEYISLDFDWSIYRYGEGSTPWLKHTGETHMEFCEVDENMIDHWEVESFGPKVCDCKFKFDIAYCDQSCINGWKD